MYAINENGCWVWTGPTCSQGRYGRVMGTEKFTMAHRQSYEVHKGEIPQGMVVCHKCDNGLCINPDHLFLGTQSTNMKDAASKKRLPRLLNQVGECNGNAKFTREFATEVRNYYKEHSPSFSALAKKFGLKSKGHAHAIATGRLWK